METAETERVDRTPVSQRRETREFLAGVLAAGLMTLAMLLLRASTGVLSLPELLGEAVIRVMPGELFSRLLDLLLRAAKPMLEVCIVLGQLAVGGLLGRLYGQNPGWRRALRLRWRGRWKAPTDWERCSRRPCSEMSRW